MHGHKLKLTIWSGTRTRINPVLRNFLTSGQGIPWRVSENRRLVMVNAMSGVAALLCLLVGTFDLLVCDMPLDAVIEFAAAIPFLGCLLALRANRIRVEGASWVCCITLCAAIIGVTLNNDIHPSDIAWAAVLPVPCYVLLGLKRGTVTVAMAGAILAGGLFYFHGTGKHHIDAITLVNGLTSMAAATIGAIIYEVSRSAAELRLLRFANTDYLTGLSNRRHFANGFQLEREQAKRTEAPLSLLLIDIDHFKQINDSYGHEAGDLALQHMARMLRANLRADDTVGRLGGEEFAVLLPDTSLAVAQERAEQLRRSIESTPFKSARGEISFTVSIGIAQMTCAQAEYQTLYTVADRNLYKAKAAGRNRVAC